MNKNLQKMKISEAFLNNKLSVGDEIYVMFSPGSNDLGYRYHKCTILSMSHLTNWNIPDESIDEIHILETEASIVMKEQYSLHVEYYLNNERHWKILKLWKDFDKIYLKEEKEILEKDMQELNKILKLKKDYKKRLQEEVNKMLQNWDYRGNIKI